MGCGYDIRSICGLADGLSMGLSFASIDGRCNEMMCLMTHWLDDCARMAKALMTVARQVRLEDVLDRWPNGCDAWDMSWEHYRIVLES